MVDKFIKKLFTQIIPDTSQLYRLVYFSHIDKNRNPKPAVFEDSEMSCDWDRYSTPNKTRDLTSKQYRYNSTEFKDKRDYFVCSIKVSKVNEICPQDNVVHDPIIKLFPKTGIPNNRSHTLINSRNKDEKDKVKLRLLLSKSARMEIFSEEEYQLAKNRQLERQKNKQAAT